MQQIHTPYRHTDYRHTERGNILFIILLALVLIGALSAAIMSSGGAENSHIDKESLAIKAGEVQRYASELERAALFIHSNGFSESDIRFAHPDAHTDYGDLSADADPTDQVFHRTGGGATYRAPPADVNDGSAWEFYGGTHLPGVGSSKPELIAVLPDVTSQFCDKINRLNNQTGQPLDTGVAIGLGANPGSCVDIGSVGRFDDGRQYYTSNINTTDETSFEQDPEAGAAYTALQACVSCTLGGYHFYHVLLAR